jgi:NAD(P)-dependent dehydrogenase (short-subunit alcohol dehydrogenase family)
LTIPHLGPGEVDAYRMRAGKPDDIAQLLLFLASEHGSYISGQSILVDGAMTLSVDPNHDDRLGPGFDFVRRAS